MHAFQSVVTPFSSKDWADDQGTCEEHFERMKIIEKEVIGTIKINAIFLILHILPLAYLGNYFLLVFKKQYALYEILILITHCFQLVTSELTPN